MALCDRKVSAGADHRFRIIGADRRRKRKSLGETASHFLQPRNVFPAFHTFRNGFQVEGLRQGQNQADNFCVTRVPTETLDKGLVDLEYVNGQFLQVRK